MRDEKDEFVASVVEFMETAGRVQFGDAVKGFWVYAEDLCPCCATRPIDATLMRGKKGLSINSFIYRDRGVLIGYLLCGVCAQQIFADAQKNPYKQTEKHTAIERTLIAAYHRQLALSEA